MYQRTSDLAHTFLCSSCGKIVLTLTSSFQRRLVKGTFLLMIFFGTLKLCSGSSETKLEVYSPVNPVDENAILSFRCQVWNLKPTEGHDVELVRILENGGIEKMFVYGNLLPSSGDNVFVAVRQLDDGSTVYFLTIMYAKRKDAGEYLCKITSTDGIDTKNILLDSNNIEVLYAPPATDPVCHYDETLTIQEGNEISLNCSAATSNPSVKMEWMRVGAGTEVLEETQYQTQNGRTYATVRFKLYTEGVQNTAMFLCKVTSSAFPDLQQSCHVGTFQIIPDSNIKKPIVTSINKVEPTSAPPPPTIRKGNDVIKGTTGKIDCQRFCESTNDSYLWMIASIIAGSAAFIFFLVFIICLLRLCREERNNNQVEQQTIEEIYSEVDAKLYNGEMRLNREYMALKKQDCHDIQGHNYVVTSEKRL